MGININTEAAEQTISGMAAAIVSVFDAGGKNRISDEVLVGAMAALERSCNTVVSDCTIHCGDTFTPEFGPMFEETLAAIRGEKEKPGEDDNE